MTNLNDTLLLVTPRMERFTIQANRLDAACQEFNLDPRRTQAEFVVFINNFMDNNECDEIGNWSDIATWAKGLIRPVR